MTFALLWARVRTTGAVMDQRRRRRALAAALALLVSPATSLSAAPDALQREDVARRAVHLLDYLGVDYPVAVQDGEVVNDLEYREQVDFAAEIDERLAILGVPDDDPLRERVGALDEAIASLAPAERILGLTREIAGGIRDRFALKALPPRTPSLEHGRALYAQACASCHGARGGGDGSAAEGLDPPPSSFLDAGRMSGLSPFALYSTITYGIDGTGMAGFADRFDEAERYDLAFYAGSLAFDEAQVERGRALIAVQPERAAERVPDLATLVETPSNELADDAGDRALVAFLRTHPERLRQGSLPLEIARAKLDASWQAYRRGEAGRAADLATSAYLDGVEPVEASLDALDSALRAAIERDFLRYRSLLRSRDGAAAAEPTYRSLRAAIDTAAGQLEQGRLAASTAFVSSMAILAREGFEAVLILVALIGVLTRSGRRDALAYVHGGWIAALVAGAATWVAASALIQASGAQREAIEGVTALLATAVLFYVSYWLVSKAEAARWQAFLDRSVRRALSTGSLAALAFVSFAAVYRELFETILFYQALFAQAGAGGTAPILLGMAAGAALLAVLSLAVFRLGRRLSLPRFFAASSALLYALAVVLAGQGVAALQEAGWLPFTWIPIPSLPWIGVYPSVEGLGLQALLLATALVAVLWTLVVARRRELDAALDETGAR